MEQDSSSDESPRNPNPPPHSLKPSLSPSFKKQQRRQQKHLKRCEKQLQQLSVDNNDNNNPCIHTPSPPSDLPWPCKPSPPQDLGWATPWADPTPPPEPQLSAEVQALVSAVKLQSNALKLSASFFATEEDDEECVDAEVDEEGGSAFRFFSEVFEKDRELRGYYLENWGKGEFYCLVCGGIGKKVWKRFGTCSGLVQHSTSVSKTRRRLAHREFARAVCFLLGWDIVEQGVFTEENVIDGECEDDIEDVDSSDEVAIGSAEEKIVA